MKSAASTSQSSSSARNEGSDAGAKNSASLISSRSRKLADQKEEKDRKLLSQLMSNANARTEPEQSDCGDTVRYRVIYKINSIFDGLFFMAERLQIMRVIVSLSQSYLLAPCSLLEGCWWIAVRSNCVRNCWSKRRSGVPSARRSSVKDSHSLPASPRGLSQLERHPNLRLFMRASRECVHAVKLAYFAALIVFTLCFWKVDHQEPSSSHVEPQERDFCEQSQSQFSVSSGDSSLSVFNRLYGKYKYGPPPPPPPPPDESLCPSAAPFDDEDVKAKRDNSFAHTKPPAVRTKPIEGFEKSVQRIRAVNEERVRQKEMELNEWKVEDEKYRKSRWE